MKMSETRRQVSKAFKKYTITKKLNNYVMYSVHPDNVKHFGKENIEIPIHRTHELDSLWDENQLQVFEDKLLKLMEYRPNRAEKRKNHRIMKKFKGLSKMFQIDPQKAFPIVEGSETLNSEAIAEINKQLVVPEELKEDIAVQPEVIADEKN